jgi:hypothetical protein
MRIFFSVVLFSIYSNLFSQQLEIDIAGVYQGTALFIQNPYLQNQGHFCLKDVYINNKRQDLNYESSAVILDFKGQELYTPVAIRIVSKDSVCKPVILNPDAILFHTSYKFTSVSLSDSALLWTTEGERQAGTYIIENLQGLYWQEVGRIQAQGKFEIAKYQFEPKLEEGGNKYRIKYEFGNGWYLYSNEMDYDYYPEPVTFKPNKVKDFLTLSRFSIYEIYNQKSEMILSGSGNQIDVTSLPPGNYVIFFGGKDPGSFTKIRR